MPWKASDLVSLRDEFVLLALQDGRNMSRLCERFEISRKTGYKWLKRHKFDQGLADHSRRPKKSPRRTAAEVEARVIELRRQHPAWGGRKLRKVLVTRGMLNVPATSTVTDILHRHGLILPEESAKHKAWQRFEHSEPNALWQMDFKGPVATDSGQCHPLTMLDDHSRYAVGLFACSNQRAQTVQAWLIHAFRRYGVPRAILADNGPPWGTVHSEEGHTELSVWLMRVGVEMWHGRPYHPQTQGKDERFHRTLKTEVLWARFAGLTQCQTRFDDWRQEYNWVRPHEALGLEVPGSRYRQSARKFSENLRKTEYSSEQEVRKVEANGLIRYKMKKWKIGKAFSGLNVAVEPAAEDGKCDVRFNGIKIKTLDLKAER
jgi:transposase InsO family protein